MLRLTVAALVAAIAAAQSSGNGTNSTAPYKNPALSPAARVADLLPRMTVEEKMAQLMQGDISNWINTTSGAFNESGLIANMEEKAGMFYVGYDISWELLVDGITIGQDYLLYNTPLGIPALVQTEGIHGFLISDATIFNSPIGFASSFNRDLVNQMAVQIGKEAQLCGATQLFAPLADLARELRYGRVEETYGEDPYLSGEIGYQYVTGLQSQNVSATAKHYVGYSKPEGGLNTAPVQGGERELRTTWLPSFQRLITDAGALSVMAAYHAWDGTPAVADHHTLTDILRDELGFSGFVTSDSGGTDRLFTAFDVCEVQDAACVTLDCLNAGCDVEMGGGSFNFRSIPALIANGTLSESVLDTAVGRVLYAKFAIGLFEAPLGRSADAAARNATINNAGAKALARQLDRESIVLMQDPSGTLPISKSARVAVVGPMASGFMNYGDYVVYESQYRGVQYLEGIEDAIGAENVVYAMGCERWSNDESGFPEAMSAAEAADVTVLLVGTWSRDQVQLWEGLNATTGEHVDLSSLNLVGAQRQLAMDLAALGKPLVIVFSSGKPITETWISNTTAALVQHFYPSEEGGNALADILFGDYAPSGKLSVSFPQDVGTDPSYYDYLKSGRPVSPGEVYADGALLFGHQYVLNTPVPWFAFGHGMSTTNFSYSDLSLSSATVAADGTVTASLTVSNTGGYDGQEVVQVYVTDVLASVVVPNMQLKGFEKVMIGAGESADVEIEIEVAKLGLWNSAMQYVVEPGQFLVMVGSASDDIRLTGNFSVV